MNDGHWEYQLPFGKILLRTHKIGPYSGLNKSTISVHHHSKDTKDAHIIVKDGNKD